MTPYTVYWLNEDNELQHFTLQSEKDANDFERMISASTRAIVLPGETNHG